MSISNGVTTKNVRLEHAEDMVLTKGIEGARQSISLLESVTHKLLGQSQPNISVTTKWDGSPAIIAGTNPETGKFFIGTKSVFSKKQPKIIQHIRDVDRFYGTVPELAELLSTAFKYLQQLEIPTILQGDMMFGSNGVVQRTINGEWYTTFKPNTILYAVPVNSLTSQYILNARMGIIFHTEYTGNTIQNLTSSAGVTDVFLQRTPDVWFENVSCFDTGYSTASKVDVQSITAHLKYAATLLNYISAEEEQLLFQHKSLLESIQVFHNALIRQGKAIAPNPEYIPGLQTFLCERINKEKIRDVSKTKKIESLLKLTTTLNPILQKFVGIQLYINEAKLLLIQKLNTLGEFKTFLETEDGIVPTSPEGFVVVDQTKNQSIKLVNRLEFSKANFDGHRII